MVGSELNGTRGKRGVIPGDIGASSFPSSFCVASVSGSIFARSLTLIPRSLHRNCTETLASQAKSPLVFFPRQYFFRALQSERLEQATPEPSFLVTWLFSIRPLPGPRSLVMIGSCLCLFVCFCFVFFYFCWCLLSHFTFKVFCCVFFSYTYYIGIQTNCSIFLASKSSVHTFSILLR